MRQTDFSGASCLLPAVSGHWNGMAPVQRSFGRLTSLGPDGSPPSGLIVFRAEPPGAGRRSRRCRFPSILDQGSRSAIGAGARYLQEMPRARFTFAGNTIVPADGGSVALLRCATSSDEEDRGMPWAYFPTPGKPKAIGVSRTDRDTPSIDWRELLHLDVSQKGTTSHADAIVLLVAVGALVRDAHERAVDAREQPLRVADLAERGWATTVPAAGQKVRSWIKPAAGLSPFASWRAEPKGKGLLMWFENVDIQFDPPLTEDLLPLDRAFAWLRRHAAWSLECLGKLKFTPPLDLATSAPTRGRCVAPRTGATTCA